MRIASALLAGLFLILPAVRAGDQGLTGTWQVSIFEQGQQLSFWLLKLEMKDGKLGGTVQAAKGFLDSSLEKVRLEGDKLLLTFKLDKIGLVDFECVAPKAGAKAIRGILEVNGQLMPVRLDPTKAESLELAKNPPPNFSYEQAKEMLAKNPDDPRLFDASATLFREAQGNKATAEEVKEWAQALVKAAARYGPRWQRETALRVAGRLASMEGYAAVAEETARQALTVIGPKGPALLRLRALGGLETVLKKAGKDEESKTVRKQIEAMEEPAYKEYSKTALPFATKEAAPRKGNRVVLVELFTGATCPPCVAADFAFDGLEHTYKRNDVVLLQYHLHIPGPDPMTNPDSEARAAYYGKDVPGTPSIMFNGKVAPNPVGPRALAEKRYNECLDIVKPLLAESAKTKVEASAVRKGDKIDITASVSDLENPGEKVKLRLVLVEDWIRFSARNGLQYHSRVVRALPGGAEGMALTKPTGKQTVTVDVGELRRNLEKYLEDKRAFANSPRPLRLQDLRVAFVQNDENHEVLQAIEVPVRRE